MSDDVRVIAPQSDDALIVEVRHVSTGVLIFRGRPTEPHEFVTLTHQIDQPARLTCVVSDLSASARSAGSIEDEP